MNEMIRHYRKEPNGAKDGLLERGSRLLHRGRRGSMASLNEHMHGENITIGLQTQPIRIDSRLVDTSHSTPRGVEGLRAQLDQQPESSRDMTEFSNPEAAPSETLAENANSVAEALPYTTVEESGGVDGLRAKLNKAEKINRRKKGGKMAATVVLGALAPALVATACSSAPTPLNGAVYNTIDCTKPVEPDILLTSISSTKPVVDRVTSNSDNQEVALLAPGQTVSIDQGGSLIADISGTTITANSGHTVIDRTGQEVVLEEAQSANNTYKTGSDGRACILGTKYVNEAAESYATKYGQGKVIFVGIGSNGTIQIKDTPFKNK